MKKSIKRIFLLLVCVVMAAGAVTESYMIQTVHAAEKSLNKDKTLIVYFSQSGTTAKVAKKMKKVTGAKIFRIRTEKGYPSDYDELAELGQDEQRQQVRPKLKNKVKLMDQYDTILIGYPIWWDDAPMAVYTFLESYDFSGKTILPFCTSGGSNIRTSVKNIRNVCKDADVKTGLTANGVTNKKIRNWLDKNKITLK